MKWKFGTSYQRRLIPNDLAPNGVTGSLRRSAQAACARLPGPFRPPLHNIPIFMRAGDLDKAATKEVTDGSHRELTNAGFKECATSISPAGISFINRIWKQRFIEEHGKSGASASPSPANANESWIVCELARQFRQLSACLTGTCDSANIIYNGGFVYGRKQ